jgi:hypothetical protein
MPINTYFSPAKICGKKRGRPEKIIEISDEKLWKMLCKNLCKQVSQIWETGKYDWRADTLRVRLIRLSKKIPLYLLHTLHSKSKYKSHILDHYRDAYLNTYKRFLILLESQGIERCGFWDAFEDDRKSPPEFIEFCSLHFPRSKVERISSADAEGHSSYSLKKCETLLSKRIFKHEINWFRSNSNFEILTEFAD